MTGRGPSFHRWQRSARIAPTLVLAWSVAAFVSARLVGISAPNGTETIGTTVVRSLVIGVTVGLAGAWLETGPLARAGRHLSLGVALLVRTLAYALAVTAGIAAIIATVSWTRFGVSPRMLVADPAFRAFLQGGEIWAMLGLLTVASFGINFGLQLRRVLGPETLFALLVGRYRRPVHEERAFAFLDLTDSTVWAERLGPLAFTDFKNDFFADVAEPVLATGGRIVQYVGDEVMVSWPMKRAEHDAAPLRFYFLVEERVAAHAARYQARYGAVPAFKCGVHGGDVVTAEVGDLKRDIVHSGDVVNTAARIEGECRPRGHRLLVSDEMLARMPALADLTHTSLGPAALRGKSQSVGLVSITRVS